MLTKKEFSRALGISVWTINNMVQAGILEPVTRGGGGLGNRAVLGLMPLVGVGVGFKLRDEERGCSMAYLAKIVKAFEGLTETELLAEFKKGHTHFVTLVMDKPVLRGAAYDWIDVQEIYKKLKKVDSAEPKPAKPHRSTGKKVAG